MNKNKIIFIDNVLLCIYSVILCKYCHPWWLSILCILWFRFEDDK